MEVDSQKVLELVGGWSSEAEGLSEVGGSRRSEVDLAVLRISLYFYRLLCKYSSHLYFLTVRA
jgi:hypothetical protein